MLLKRFLRYFLSVQATEPEQTTIQFTYKDSDGIMALTIRTVEYDVANNRWSVNLA